MYVPKDAFGREYPLELALRQVGKGWSDLVEECYQICVDNEIDITQIKEKFGTLRFYIVSGTNEIFDKIDDICARSVNICEQCGTKGELRNLNGWYLTLCENCYDNQS